MGILPETPEQLREYICRLLHDANTGKIVPDDRDPTKYGAMADALMAAGFELSAGWEYGWAPHANAEKLPTEEKAKKVYFMAVGYPVRRWKRRIRSTNDWVPAEDE